MKISFYRVRAVILGHISHMTQDALRFIEVFYWPLMDLISWGYASVWTETQQSSASSILVGALLWHLITRINYEISFSFLEEVWSQNLVNLFASPLRLSEWMLATLLLAIFVACIVCLFLSMIIYFLYGFIITTLGWRLLPIIGQLIISGLWVGFLCASLVSYRGKRAGALIYIVGWLFDPFSCIYYAIDVLPPFAQTIARLLPMSYTFEAMRSLVIHKTLPVSNLVIGLILNCFYLILALLIFKTSFEANRNRGLERLTE